MTVEPRARHVGVLRDLDQAPARPGGGNGKRRAATYSSREATSQGRGQPGNISGSRDEPIRDHDDGDARGL
jgi:hypothetical protein